MDLNDLIPTEDSAKVVLKYKDKVLKNEDGSDMTWEVYLPHSKPYKKVRHEQADFLIAKGDDRPKSAEYEDLTLEFLSGITKGFDITAGGEKPKFSKKKAKELLESLPFIGGLIQEELKNHEDFI